MGNQGKSIDFLAVFYYNEGSMMVAKCHVENLLLQ